MKQSNGIIITSSTPDAGKTLVTAGLAGAILEMGIEIAAVKPIAFGADGVDTAFFTMATKRPVFYERVVLNSWTETSSKTWIKLINICTNFSHPVIFEAPNSVSTPIKYDNEILDITDLAIKLDWPIILTSKADDLFYESTVQAISFLQQKESTTLGFIVTCPNENLPYEWVSSTANKISTKYCLPCLGIYPFSPSINIKEKKQGNVIKLTNKHVDLYAIQSKLNLIIA